MSKVTLTRRLRGLRDGADLVGATVETVVIHFVDDDGRTVSLAFDGRFDCVDDCRDRVETYQILSDCPVIRDNAVGQREQSGPTSRVITELRNALNDLRD
jgi:hypothetical protein